MGLPGGIDPVCLKCNNVYDREARHSFVVVYAADHLTVEPLRTLRLPQTHYMHY